MSDTPLTPVDVTRVARSSSAHDSDVLAVEEPLEIRVAWGGREKNIAVTMRTPGDDFDLAAGFLFTEGVVRAAEQVESIRHWGSPNVVRVALRDGVTFDASKLDRHFYTTSSCGICGKTSIEAVRVAVEPLPNAAPSQADLIHRLPSLLETGQSTFRRTGGLHGAAIFTAGGELLCLREDVGRHNAVDKAIGTLFREGRGGAILMVSGRASFELVQKAIVARIGVLAAVGAPSSLAVDLARELNLTLLGFVRDDRFNIYAGDVCHSEPADPRSGGGQRGIQ
jgi:FdhD protein